MAAGETWPWNATPSEAQRRFTWTDQTLSKVNTSLRDEFANLTESNGEGRVTWNVGQPILGFSQQNSSQKRK
jgi:hypothetical protein